jgi:predicted nucleotidyltransferase component of viral defense system
MIGRGEITKQAQIDRVDAQTVERDYILAHVAIEISAGAREQMVLTGGTSLRLVHYENYRYSADLDYSLIGISTDQAFETIEAALKRCRDQISIDTLELDLNATPPRITYIGPLGAKPRSIKLDLADDELVIEHRSTPAVVAWRDLPTSGSIHCYMLTEICAEKLRCTIQRRQCRDVYDLWTMLEDHRGPDLFKAWHRFEQKAEHKQLDPQRF